MKGVIAPGVMVDEPDVIQGHPAVELYHGHHTPPTLITVCAACGKMRSILFLTKDRWFCTTCKAEGAAPPNLYPIG